MKFMCPLFIVLDIKRSKGFYEEVLGRTVKYDFGANILFEGDFSIQEKKSFTKIAEIEANRITFGANDAELYFEEADFDGFIKKLDSLPEIRYVHAVKTHDWGQRVVRLYDPDGHIVEVGEDMEEVARRMLRQGCSVAQTAQKTQYPVEFVESLLGDL